MARQEYPHRYGHQMGTEAPHVANLKEALSSAANGAVYASRNGTEFGIVVWNWSPSTTPFRFEVDLQPLSSAALAHLDQTNTDAYIVAKDGVIIHEHYVKGMHQTTRHTVQSAGKSWISAVWHAALLPAMEKRVGDLLPELEGTVYGNETLRAVSDMRVPVFWYEKFEDPESPVVLSGKAGGWEYAGTDYEQVAFIKSLRRDPELNGSDWHYVSSNSEVMALLGAKLSGQHPYEATRRFYEAIGMEYMSSSTGNFRDQYEAAGGQSITLRDFVKLPYAMANKGVIDGRSVVSNAYIADVFRSDAQRNAAWRNGSYGSDMPWVQHYSNQWYVVDDDIAFGMGSYGQYIIFNRRTNVAIGMFSTYELGQDKKAFTADIPWLIEQVGRY